MEKLDKPNAYWREQLDDETYRVTREQGTEYPGTGKYLYHDEQGDYYCVCCDSKLFSSAAKFDSGCGWPSFDLSVDNAIEYKSDDSHGMTRVEIVCKRCDAHLGHIFDDGPTETGKRYCVNSVSLTFKK